MHPAKEGFSALPFFDEFDLSTVDILLISQYVIPLRIPSDSIDCAFWKAPLCPGLLWSFDAVPGTMVYLILRV